MPASNRKKAQAQRKKANSTKQVKAKVVPSLIIDAKTGKKRQGKIIMRSK
jgi:hypothetical protein